ncbi:membrane protein [Bacillaceae bacterium JMAK1]|nr:membrane protein [Bacillaceae bacterium JMAK1]
MSGLQRIALILVIIGAINWGLIGFFSFDLVAAIFGGQSAAFARVIYAIVGLAGLYSLSILFKPSEEIERSPEPERH